MSHYLISEASRLVDEESHVLRYWEEELALKIPRNDLGHRYYTEVQLEIFRIIKDLKQQGYQLKDIKQYLEEMDQEKERQKKEQKEKKLQEKMQQEKEPLPEEENGEESPDEVLIPEELPLILPPEELKTAAAPEQARVREFRELMAEILADVMEAGYSRMTDDITEQVSRRVIKEINYLEREREEWEEEHFKQLDEAIRSCQRRGRFRAEAAAAAEPEKRRRWKLTGR